MRVFMLPPAPDPPIVFGRAQEAHERGAEHAGEDLVGDEGVRATLEGEPVAVRIGLARGDEGVDVEVLFEIVVPGLEHNEDAGPSAQPLRVLEERGECEGDGLQEEFAHALVIADEEDIEVVRRREDNVPVIDVEQLLFATWPAAGSHAEARREGRSVDGTSWLRRRSGHTSRS